jgi:hypothetical protein
MANWTGGEAMIGRANLLLHGLGYSPEEIRVEPFQDIAVLRGKLVTQRIDTPEALMSAIRDLPTRSDLVALSDDEVDESSGGTA